MLVNCRATRPDAAPITVPGFHDQRIYPEQAREGHETRKDTEPAEFLDRILGGRFDVRLGRRGFHVRCGRSYSLDHERLSYGVACVVSHHSSTIYLSDAAKDRDFRGLAGQALAVDGTLAGLNLAFGIGGVTTGGLNLSPLSSFCARRIERRPLEWLDRS